MIVDNHQAFLEAYHRSLVTGLLVEERLERLSKS